MIAPTRVGAGFAGLACLLYMASMQATTGLLFLVLGIVFACFVYNAFEARRSGMRLEVTPPSGFRGAEGAPLEGAWTVRNPTQRVAGGAEVRSDWGSVLRVGVLAPGAEIRLRSRLKLPRRGVYAYRRLRMDSAFPFGLVRARRSLQVRGEIIVYPAVYACDPPAVSGFEPMLGGRCTGGHRAAAGERFHGVRPMQDRDPVRLIHWPSSSKGQGLMVREFDAELSGRVALLIEPGAGTAPDGEPLLDWAARAAGSLALAALDAGQQVDMVDVAAKTVMPVPPFADPEIALLALARLSACRQPLRPATVDELVARVSPKAALCFVLCGPNPAVACHLEASPLYGRRVLTVCLPEIAGDTWRGPGRVRVYGAHEMVEASRTGPERGRAA